MFDPEYDVWMAERELMNMGWLGRLFRPSRAKRLADIRDHALKAIDARSVRMRP